MSSPLREVKVSADVYQAVQNRFGSHFATVDELVEFALRELLRDDSAVLDQSEQQMIRNRLKDLGYL
jgi:hypothetical protein